MFNISQVSAGPVHETADTLQMAPYNVRAMARFVNIHKQGLREQAQQNEKMHLELVKYIDTSKTQGCNDLQEAKLELVKYMDTSKTQGFNDLLAVVSSRQHEGNLELVRHIDTLKAQGYNDLMAAQIELGISKEKERLLQEQLSSVTANLNSVTAEKNVLTNGYAELSNSLKVERELKRSKTAEFNAQGAELKGIKSANLELTSANAKLLGDNVSYEQTNKELADELVRLKDTVRIKTRDLVELQGDFKVLQRENTHLQNKLLQAELEPRHRRSGL